MRRAASGMRALVVNGDDFGQSHGINLGIVEAHERGIVTSASLMVRGEAAEAAAGYARQNPGFGVGLHVDLGEWVYRDGRWCALYEVVAHRTRQTLADEVQRQVDAFVRLTGGDPSHIDSHQHVHREEPLRTLLADLSSQLNVPLRHHTRGIVHCGHFYGHTGRGEPLPEAITVEALAGLIENLDPGVTEISCHPGKEVDFVSPYAHERLIELEVLCHPAVRATIENEGVRLCSFDEAMAHGESGSRT